MNRFRAPVQCATDYTYDDILWNRRFVEIYTQTRRLTVDYGRFHDTEEASPASAGYGELYSLWFLWSRKNLGGLIEFLPDCRSPR
jgi:hypothetical protein